MIGSSPLGILAYPEPENSAQSHLGIVPNVAFTTLYFFLYRAASPTLEQGFVLKGSEATLKGEARYTVLHYILYYSVESKIKNEFSVRQAMVLLSEAITKPLQLAGSNTFRYFFNTYYLYYILYSPFDALQ